jgi:hypothetical protein
MSSRDFLHLFKVPDAPLRISASEILIEGLVAELVGHLPWNVV